MRYKIIIEYDGSGYIGFQKQPTVKAKSVEEVLELALFKLTQKKIKIFVSGRTDAGVHALGQVIHFDLEKEFAPERILMGLNNYLRSEETSVICCSQVSAEFHARFSAKMRHYRYLLINRKAPLTLQKNRAWHVAKKLDISAMKAGADFLIGEHDFSSFRDSDCQASSPIRTMQKIVIEEKIGGIAGEISIEFSAKSFLHHMVRNIVGTLVLVGLGKIQPEEIKKILQLRDRTKSGPNAPACGLYFLGVDY